MKILFLVGDKGAVGEQEVGFNSSKNLAQALQQYSYETKIVDGRGPAFRLNDHLEGTDAIISFLYDRALLEKTSTPFLGSKPAAIKNTADKARYKELLSSHGIRVPKGEVVDKTSFATSELARHPYVLKPIGGSSTIDTYIVHDPKVQPEGINDTFERYNSMLLEELIVGREITVPVLGDVALPIILIIPPEGEDFTYDNKYNGKTIEIVAPSEIPEAKAKEAQELALKIHHLAGMRHLSRTDMIIAENGDLYTLETNGMPGQTPHSLLPKSAAAAGLPLALLAKKLVELALSSK
jgi:D-alanine-D-alanine ligase